MWGCDVYVCVRVMGVDQGMRGCGDEGMRGL